VGRRSRQSANNAKGIPTAFTSEAGPTFPAQLGSVANLSYIICIGFARASLPLQLPRLAPSPRMCIVIWTLFAVSGMSTIVAFCVSISRCTPPSGVVRRLDPTKLEDNCQKHFPVRFAVGALNILTDVIVWLVPLPVILEDKGASTTKDGTSGPVLAWRHVSYRFTCLPGWSQFPGANGKKRVDFQRRPSCVHCRNLGSDPFRQ
jgi:hypothetical protein